MLSDKKEVSPSVAEPTALLETSQEMSVPVEVTGAQSSEAASSAEVFFF